MTDTPSPSRAGERSLPERLLDMAGRWGGRYGDRGLRERAEATVQLLQEAAHDLRAAEQARDEAHKLTKLALAELAGYKDGFEGMPQVQPFSTSDENLAYVLWFGKGRKERSNLIDQTDTLSRLLKDERAQLATLTKERDEAQEARARLEDALRAFSDPSNWVSAVAPMGDMVSGWCGTPEPWRWALQALSSSPAPSTPSEEPRP